MPTTLIRMFSACLLALLFIMSPAAGADKDCSLSFFMGEVQVRPAGQQGWKDAEWGMTLKTGDVIRTMVESRAELTMANGSKVNVEEKSIFEIKKMDAAQEQTNFKLLSGKISANVKKLTKSRSEFKVESPVAIAAIRGTQFSMRFTEGKANISVKEGKVEVKVINSKQTVTLTENQQVDVSDKGFEIKVIEETEGKDETPPKLNMESPEAGGVYTKAEVEVKGSTEPTAVVTVNAQDVKVGKDGKFSTKVTLDEGTQEVTVTGTDTAGNVMELIYELAINTSAPEVTAASSVGDTTTAEVCEISGTVTDKTPEDVVIATINKEEIVLEEGKFKKAFRLKESENIFEIEAADAAGNVGKATVKVHRKKGDAGKDAEAPVINLSSSVGTETEEEACEISGMITDNYPAEELAITIAGPDKTESVATKDGTISLAVTLNLGDNVFTVTAKDKAGNTATQKITVKRNKETVPPLVMLSSSVGMETDLDKAVINGTVEDNAGLTGLKATIAGPDKTDNLDVGSGAFSYNVDLKDGDNTFVVTATDLAGNNGTAQITISKKKDDLPPAVNLSTSTGEQTSEQTALIYVVITDNYPADQLKATIKVNDKTEDLNLVNGNAVYTAVLTDGENKFIVTATDRAGNGAAGEVLINKTVSDATPPVLTVLTDLDKEFTNLSPIRITVNVQDLEGVENCRLVIDGEVVEMSGGTYNHLAYLEEGNNRISIVATDGGGNETAEELQVFYDHIAPTILVTRPAEGITEANLPAPPTGYDGPVIYTVTGFIQDPEPSSGIEYLTLNGADIKFNDDGSFEHEFEIERSRAFSMDLTFEVMDRAGNRTMDTSKRLEISGNR